MSGEVYSPVNYDGRTHGTCQLQACMGNSLNIPAVKVELGIGVSTVVQMARTMGAPPYTIHGTDQNGFGIYTNDDPLNSYGPSLTLGGYGETPLQMATGASVLATQGILREPYAVTLITRADQLLFVHTTSPGSGRICSSRWTRRPIDSLAWCGPARGSPWRTPEKAAGTNRPDAAAEVRFWIRHARSDER